MANRFLGEATVKMDGEEYTLRCDFNAMCFFEDATGKDALATFEAYEGGNVSTRDMRHMMHAFLAKHHPDASLDLAGDILSSDLDALARVVQAASPEPTGEEGNAEAA